MPKDHPLAITAHSLLEFYQNGLFPMADSADDTGFYLINPETRTIFIPETFHIPKSLKKFMRKTPWLVTYNQNFTGVIDLCRAPRKGRMNTWINTDIRDLFIQLHALGHAHSVEIWDQNRLIGGVYGLAVGQIFCAESMASLESNASSVALVHLMAHLKDKGFILCDVQFNNPHLEKFKPNEISKDTYLTQLKASLNTPARFINT